MKTKEEDQDFPAVLLFLTSPLFPDPALWQPGRDSNPDTQLQRLQSYR
jgi:hypothetical protein